MAPQSSLDQRPLPRQVSQKNVLQEDRLLKDPQRASAGCPLRFLPIRWVDKGLKSGKRQAYLFTSLSPYVCLSLSFSDYSKILNGPPPDVHSDFCRLGKFYRCEGVKPGKRQASFSFLLNEPVLYSLLVASRGLFRSFTFTPFRHLRTTQ